MRRLFASRVGLVLVALALVLLLHAVAAACPNCKDAMEKQDPTHGGMVKGYFYSILFMMSTPYLLLGSFCAVMYYRVRRARQAGKLNPPLAGAAVMPKTSQAQAEPALKSVHAAIAARESLDV
jgi:hypothetical protein